jgi:hypothetical protein
MGRFPLGRFRNLPRRRSFSYATEFSAYSTATPSFGDHQSDASSVWGEVIEHAIDLRSARPGDKISIPYELTVSESMQDFWHSAFHLQDRISTSTPFARKIGLQDKVLPFSFVLFLTSSMTHADSAKVQVGFGKASYIWPCFPGDTFTKSFEVHSIRNTSDGNHSIFYFTCNLINQRNRICMTADKRMLFEFKVPESNITTDKLSSSSGHHIDSCPHLFIDHLISEGSTLHELGSQSLTKLYPGQLIFHPMNRSLTLTQAQQLASLARLTHPRHFDIRRYDPTTEIMIPGGLVLGLVSSAASRDLHEILHEELLSCSYVNSLHPKDVVSAMTFVNSIEPTNGPGDLETVHVRTVGVKNIDLVRELTVDRGLPLELFTGKIKSTRADVEKVCNERIPALSNKIIVIFDRKLLRQARKHDVFLL